MGGGASSSSKYQVTEASDEDIASFIKSLPPADQKRVAQAAAAAVEGSADPEEVFPEEARAAPPDAGDESEEEEYGGEFEEGSEWGGNEDEDWDNFEDGDGEEWADEDWDEGDENEYFGDGDNEEEEIPEEVGVAVKGCELDHLNGHYLDHGRICNGLPVYCKSHGGWSIYALNKLGLKWAIGKTSGGSNFVATFQLKEAQDFESGTESFKVRPRDSAKMRKIECEVSVLHAEDSEEFVPPPFIVVSGLGGKVGAELFEAGEEGANVWRCGEIFAKDFCPDDNALLLEFQEEKSQWVIRGEDTEKVYAKSRRCKCHDPVDADWKDGVSLEEVWEPEEGEVDINEEEDVIHMEDTEPVGEEEAAAQEEEAAAAEDEGSVPFVDKVMPPNHTGFGPLESPFNPPHAIQELANSAFGGDLKNASWIRCPKLLDQRASIQLFDNVVPNDIRQGQIGDCYALAAIASVAEFPDFVKNEVFVTKELSKNGKYTVRLYDFGKEDYVNVTVDDFVPCRKVGPKYHPVMARSNGNEIWVMILEKAMAKFVGSYSHLGNGGHTVLAMMNLVGKGDALYFILEKDMAKRTKLSAEARKEKPRDMVTSMKMYLDGEATPEQFWKLMVKFDKANFPMACGFKAASKEDVVGKGQCGEDIVNDGLVRGHAYTLIAAKEVVGKEGKKYHLVQMRNPWGCKEWLGPWSDKAKEWTECLEPETTKKLRGATADDGTFWMSYRDFWKKASSVQVVQKSMSTKRGQVGNF